MAKFWESTVTYPYSWLEVVKGFWSKYPNSYSSHVISEDTLESEIINGMLYTKRLLVKTNPLPKWGEYFYKGQRHVYIIEEALVDPKEKTLTTYRRNVNLKGLMEADERNVFSVCPDDPSNSTSLCKQAWISSHMRGISYAVQAYGVERYKYNAKKSDKGFLSVLCNLYGSHSITEAKVGKLQKLKDNADKMRKQSDILLQKASNFKKYSKEKSELVKCMAHTAAHRAREPKEMKEIFRVKIDQFKERSRSKATLMKEKARQSNFYTKE